MQPGTDADALQIRPLRMGDIPGIMAIERESFSTPWRETTFAGLIVRGDSDLIGAVRGGELVGYAVAWTIVDQSELGNVAVAASQRGQGIGRRLIEAALERIRQRGARECFLEVRESNTVARALYQEFGFRTVGRRRNYYARPVEDALVMRLDLL